MTPETSAICHILQVWTSQNDQCLNMTCDGNWHNKESFYPYWIINDNQYIGMTDSLKKKKAIFFESII